MNLIEQLGGYEKAKEKRDDISHTLDNSEILGGGDAREGLYERLESIDKALHEYRRQHNIFEVLDLIMYENKLYEIKYIYHPEKARITDGFQGRTVYDFPSGIRHATDEEIKAGKRLEVK